MGLDGYSHLIFIQQRQYGLSVHCFRIVGIGFIFDGGAVVRNCFPGGQAHIAVSVVGDGDGSVRIDGVHFIDGFCSVSIRHIGRHLVSVCSAADKVPVWIVPVNDHGLGTGGFEEAAGNVADDL